MGKTGKRETAWAFGTFVIGCFIYGLVFGDSAAIDVAKYLTPFSVGFLTAALGMDAYAKQIKG